MQFRQHPNHQRSMSMLKRKDIYRHLLLRILFRRNQSQSQIA